jgi:hypothetical protein
MGQRRHEHERKTKKRATAVADMSVRAPLVQKQQLLSVNIMFLESVPSLIAVATSFDLVLAVSLKTTYMDRAQRTAAAIKAGLDNMVRTMAGQGFDVTTIYSDGEGTIRKRKYHLCGLTPPKGRFEPATFTEKRRCAKQ